LAKLTVIARLKAKPGKERVVYSELIDLIGKTRIEKGCLNYDLHRNLDDPSEFWFYENWESREALDAHLGSPHLVRIDALSKELFAEEPQLMFLEMISTPA